MAISKLQVSTLQAPEPIGPYSQAVMCSGVKTLYVSGQVAIDPVSGTMVDGDVAQQTKCVLDNIEAILSAAGVTFDDIVRVEVFLTDLKNDFQTMNSEYVKRFSSKCPPARQAIGVAALPRGAKVEISCIAMLA